MTGVPCWMDLLTSDAGRAREFYTSLFGWTAGEPSEEFGGYFMFLRDGVPAAGGMQKVPGMPGEDLADQWGVYLSSPDAKTTLDRALASGAQLRVGPYDIADLGTEAILTDPVGARIGIWQPKSFPGFTRLGVPGTPAYFELLTRDYAAAIGFYTDVFDWDGQAADTEQVRLTVLRRGQDTVAGIMDGAGFLPAGQQSVWGVYLKVPDTDAALTRVAELGGSVIQPAMDTPYGRLAAVADPTGAQLKLVG